MTPTQGEAANARVGSEDHILFLDHIRGIAIFLVLVYHALGASYGMDQLPWNGLFRDFNHVPRTFLPLLPFSIGWMGVAIFFVVSGFCIHLSYERSKRKEFRVFFLRRFFRIYPPYLLAFCFFAFLFPLTKLRFDLSQNLAQIGSHLLLINNIDKGLFYGVNGSFWSIVIEAQLYLIYPILLLIVRRFGWEKALWFSGLVEVTLRAACAYPPLNELCASPFFYWFSWSIGAKLADDYLKGRPLFLATCPVWVWPTLTLAAYLFKPTAIFAFLLASLATTTWISHLLSRPATQEARPSTWASFFQRLGVISYSLYLIHQPFLNAFGQSLTFVPPRYRMHTFFIFLCTLGFCGIVLCVAWLFHRFVELPSIEMGKRYLKRHFPVRSATPTLASDGQTL